MNMQAMIKQAQQMQKEMMKAKQEIDEKEFTVENEAVVIKMTGNKKVVDYKIKLSEVETNDCEMIEDMTVIAVNQIIEEIEKETEAKLGQYTKGMPGVF